MIPIDRGQPRRLIWTTVSTGTYYYPAVSPTAGVPAYALCRQAFTCDLHVVELNPELTSTGPPRRLTEQNSTAFGIAWAPDARSLIYGSGAGIAGSVIVASPSRGRPARTSGAHWGPRRISCGFQPGRPVRVHASQHGRGHLEVQVEWTIGTFPFVKPRRTQSAVFTKREENRVCIQPTRQRHPIWVANSDGTNPTPLNEGAKGVGGSPRWSPDSRRIVFDGHEPDGQRGIYVVDAEGGPPTLMAHPGGALPSWSQDGKWIHLSPRRSLHTRRGPNPPFPPCHNDRYDGALNPTREGVVNAVDRRRRRTVRRAHRAGHRRRRADRRRLRRGLRAGGRAGRRGRPQAAAAGPTGRPPSRPTSPARTSSCARSARCSSARPRPLTCWCRAPPSSPACRTWRSTPPTSTTCSASTSARSCSAAASPPAR